MALVDEALLTHLLGLGGVNGTEDPISDPDGLARVIEIELMRCQLAARLLETRVSDLRIRALVARDASQPPPEGDG